MKEQGLKILWAVLWTLMAGLCWLGLAMGSWSMIAKLLYPEDTAVYGVSVLVGTLILWGCFANVIFWTVGAVRRLNQMHEGFEK